MSVKWSEEVGILRSRVVRLLEYGFQERDYRLSREAVAFISVGCRPSRLRSTLENAGVKFGSEIERSSPSGPCAYSEMLTPLLLLGLFEGGEGSFSRELFFEWRHVIRDLRRESEYGELRRVALEHLSKKYGPGEEPFEPYMAVATDARKVNVQALSLVQDIPLSQNSGIDDKSKTSF